MTHAHPDAPVVAVVGGGQLARMMAEPAAALGIPLRLLAEAPGVSAAQVIPDHVVGDYTDLATLRDLVVGCQVVTFDHEHVPTSHLHALADGGTAVRPGPEALVHAQDKVVMREALSRIDAPLPAFRVVASVADVSDFGFPCVLKTSRGGYDGKGVWFVGTPTSALRRSRRPPRAAYGCWPSSTCRSAESCPPWWCAARAARLRPIRWSSPPSATASAAR